MEVSDLVGLPSEGARQQTSQSHPLPSDEHCRDCKILIKFVPCIYYCPLLLLDKKCVFLWIMYLSTCRHNLLMLKLTTGRLYHSSDIFQQQSPAVSTSSLMKKTARKKTHPLCPKSNRIRQLEKEGCQGFGSTATICELQSHQPCLHCLNFHILGERQLDTLLNSYAWMQGLVSVHFPQILLGEMSNTVIAYQNLSLCDFREEFLQPKFVLGNGRQGNKRKQDTAVNFVFLFPNCSTLSWGWLREVLTSSTQSVH